MKFEEPTQANWSRQELIKGDLGYNFALPQHGNAPGGHQLIIQIHDRPTYHHFDPEHVQMIVWTDEGYHETLTLHHPWPYSEYYQAYPGRIYMIDRLGKEAHAFSFGGKWEIQSRNDITRLSLFSAAPILDCNQPETIAAILADEIEILIAEQRAQRHALGVNLPDGKRGCDPWLVYAACLQALLEKYQRLDVSTSPSLFAFHQFLVRENTGLRQSGQMPANLPELDCLF